jgi:hydrophobe/amphiphile efflux-1 (HAE1) family protein
MARFFIDRPVFAIVLAIIIVIVGGVAIPSLPMAAYPEVVPPVVQITATYLGGNGEDLEKTVAQPIEEQLTGLDGMLYYQSTSANNGQMNINVTFELGTDPDIATVQTQNKVNAALPRLPEEVQRQGVTVRKVSSAFLMAVNLVSKDNTYSSTFLANYAQINLVNQLGSLPGIGESRLGSQETYSMRVWLDPERMAQLGLTATDVASAIRAQNRQNPAGAVGQAPTPDGTDLQFAVRAPGRLTDISEFENIVVRAQPDASLLRVRDIGRVELGSQSYSGFSRLDGQPAGVIILYLAPGANAVETADSIHRFLEEAKKVFPSGIEYHIPYDSTMFVRTAIQDVVTTLMEAVVLVLFVVFLFLQNWRATLIPLVTVPVSIIGTFAVFPLLGFSINITSLFGLVLAIGIVVDDAIVVVEAVQRHIDEGMAPREATIRAMQEVSAPVVAIAFILAAVFIPVAFIGGISGQIYKQFALTIAVSVLISAFSALSLSPALSAMLLRPHKKSRSLLSRFFGAFNRAFEWTNKRYLGGVIFLIRRSSIVLAFLVIVALTSGWLFKTLPTGFLPDEDQGAFFTSVRLPDGASTERTDAAVRKIEQLLSDIPGVQNVMTIGGLDIATQTSSSNVATVIGRLDPWEDRTTTETQLDAILGQAYARFATVPEALTLAFGLPPILGLSTTSGFQFMLEDRAGGDIQTLSDTADALVAAARQRPELANVVSTFRGSVPTYNVSMNMDKLQTLGIPVSDAYNALQTFLGGLYVNDFNLFGRTWQVRMQAEQQFRDEPADIGRFFVRTRDGEMVPMSTLAGLQPSGGPEVVYRYNRYRSIYIMGSAAPGYTSGQAADAMQEVADATLPPGFGYEWTGTTFQEKAAQGNEAAIFAFSSILVFLSLAALYESWSIPFAVLFAIPLGILGALASIFMRSYAYDIYTQIGIVTLIGLSAKNAILIVEFARERYEHGVSIGRAAVEAARLRLRPILMTSFAFILGVLPLVISTGASSGARRALGTVVFGGMLAATLLPIFVVPVLFVLVVSFAERRKKREAAGHAPVPEAAQ